MAARALVVVGNCAIFTCPRKWEQLETTDDKNVRTCWECKKHVHLVTDEGDLQKHVDAGDCVALKVPKRPEGLTGAALPLDDLNLSVSAAMKLARQQVGNWMKDTFRLVHVERPMGPFYEIEDDIAGCIFFEIIQEPRRIGATHYAAVSRKTGRVHGFRSGE